MKICKNKFLNVILNILIIVTLSSCIGILIGVFLEYVLWLVFLIPAIVSFLGQALSNGGKVG